MSIVVVNKTITIPNVSQQSDDSINIGSKKRTPLGNLVIQKVDRKWKRNFSANKITKTEFDNLENHLQDILGGKTYFWLDEFGGNANDDSVEAVIEITNSERVSFGRNGNWHNDGRNIEFEVEKV